MKTDMGTKVAVNHCSTHVFSYCAENSVLGMRVFLVDHKITPPITGLGTAVVLQRLWCNLMCAEIVFKRSHLDG